MPCYVLCNAAGGIEMWDAQPFPGSSLADYDVVRGWDGRPYKAGEEPPQPVDSIVEAKRAVIDAETSSAITTGFEYTVDGVSYHFSYDSFDQQNFADTANVALLAQMGGKGLPESVAWNAYKNWKDGQGEQVRLTFTAESFLALYTGGAVAHKAARMAEGGAGRGCGPCRDRRGAGGHMTDSRKAELAHNTKQLLIALDQTGNAALGLVAALVALCPCFGQAGLWWADETISAHCWRWHINGVRSWPCRIVDSLALVFGDKNHCEESFWSEVEG